MSTRRAPSLETLSRTALCLVLSTALQTASSESSLDRIADLRAAPAARASRNSLPRSPEVLPVFTCADSGPGSLRAAVESAVDGDTIDLAELTCSLITLSTGITVTVASLTLLGPGSDRLAITDPTSDTGGIVHVGYGVVDLQGLSLQDTNRYLPGACLYSHGSVYLEDVTVQRCAAHDDLGVAQYVAGGGIYAQGIVRLENSRVTENEALAAYGQNAFGGGVFAGSGLRMHNSTISGNEAISGYQLGLGGGAFALKYADVYGSTIAMNRAGYGEYLGDVGGLVIAGYGMDSTPSVITDSTIYGNSATNLIGGIHASAPLTLHNSTVTSNDARYNGMPGKYVAAGVHVYETSADISSSIIAHNNAANYPFDLSGYVQTITGSHNLIMASLIAPPDTITDDPELGVLADNGGPTYTQALSPTSPAIDRGSDNGLTSDQRGPPYVRVAGAAADIGAFELQQGIDDQIFADGFDP